MIHDILNIKHNKYKIIIIVQWKMAHNLPFFSSHKNYNEININHSPWTPRSRLRKSLTLTGYSSELT